MITIKLTDKRLEVRGHAGYSEPGKDIVCAAVSILIYTFVELNQAVVLTDVPDSMIVDTSNADTRFISKGFELLQEQYPDNVKLI